MNSASIFACLLFQGLDLIKRLGLLHLLPVGHQLVLVLVQPLVNHIEGTAGKLPLHGSRRDVYCGLISLVLWKCGGLWSLKNIEMMIP